MPFCLLRSCSVIVVNTTCCTYLHYFAYFAFSPDLHYVFAVSVSLSATLCKKFCTDLHEPLCIGWSWGKEEMIKFSCESAQSYKRNINAFTTCCNWPHSPQRQVILTRWSQKHKLCQFNKSTLDQVAIVETENNKKKVFLFVEGWGETSFTEI